MSNDNADRAEDRKNDAYNDSLVPAGKEVLCRRLKTVVRNKACADCQPCCGANVARGVIRSAAH